MNPEFDISSFLALNNMGVEGSTLFCYQWGNNNGNGILVSNGSGPPPKRLIGDTSTIKQLSISILIRNSSLLTARTNAKTIYALLDNATINGYVSCYCNQPEPIFINKEKNINTENGYMYYFSVSIDLVYV